MKIFIFITFLCDSDKKEREGRGGPFRILTRLGKKIDNLIFNYSIKLHDISLRSRIKKKKEKMFDYVNPTDPIKKPDWE